MWLKQLKKKNEKNIVLVDNEQLPNTSLNSLNITHFPSTFEIPAGGKATLLSNPQDEKSLDALVNSAPTEPEEISASDYVNMTPRPTVVNSKNSSSMNSMNSTSSRPNSMNSSPTEKTRDGFTPSLEKLKGGRRTKRKSSKRRMTRRR